VMRIAHRIRTGQEVGRGWSEWGRLREQYDPLVLADLLDRARIVAGSGERIGQAGPGETVRSIMGPSHTGDVGGPGGPIQTGQATADVIVQIPGPRGTTVWKTVRVRVSWDAPIDTLLAALDDAIAETAADYGAEYGGYSPAQLVIF
ncbi:MAG TPA: hypothetical protein VK545_07900, partial [Streptomyces sp.]|nr:hypothetical protein [Streptomyces sp.]